MRDTIANDAHNGVDGTAIARLTEALEFIASAIRSAALGHPATSYLVADPLAWARQAMAEADAMIYPDGIPEREINTTLAGFFSELGGAA